MKLLQFYDNQMLRLGLKQTNGVIDLAAAGFSATLTDIIRENAVFVGLRDFVAALPEHGAWLKAEADLILAPCIPLPEKIICIGLNYHDHARETKGEIPKTPVVFSKFNNTLTSATAAIPLPANMQQADYEVELGVVIGKAAQHVPVETALEHVFGYCTLDDLSARDWQFLSSQWLLGKTSDHFLPCGPYLVTADEVPDPQNLALRTWVNGALRQNGHTQDMIFSVAYLIHYLSQHMTLKAGDIISTGTPAGVILGMPHPRIWLQAGDVVEVEVEGLGRCTNTFVAG
jgi:2-keto-4-pentenoate hydratase/2-oxohepta-3-ene-1,7-dioic acid hydratase in catechol pathway